VTLKGLNPSVLAELESTVGEVGHAASLRRGMGYRIDEGFGDEPSQRSGLTTRGRSCTTGRCSPDCPGTRTRTTTTDLRVRTFEHARGGPSGLRVERQAVAVAHRALTHAQQLVISSHVLHGPSLEIAAQVAQRPALT